MIAPSVTPGLTSPFRGLAPFGDSELDAMLFFGRERETEIAVANLIAARLTVLYGPSGVGKSSLLNAGVARRVRELGARRAVGRGPDVAVVVFSAWAEDPVRALKDAIESEVAPLVSPLAPKPPADCSLADAAEHWSRLLDGDLCIGLDQLEEHFVYHEDDDGPGTLVGELPEVVMRPGLRANVMLSLRDDSLSQLDVLKAPIPGLFANTLRLDRLDTDAARAAILGPVQRWNELVDPDKRVEVEPVLVDDVIAQSGAAGDVGRIEAPYLQLVMERVWNEERKSGSRMLRPATLVALGGAAMIVSEHLDRALSVLGPDEQDAAARMFEHLVTPSGTKIAHRSSDLAKFAKLPIGEARPVLSTLGRERILRPLDETAGAGDRYEIFHDVLAAAILEWSRRRELDTEREAAHRRQRRLLGGLALALVLLLTMGGLTVYAFDQRQTAQEQAAAADAARLDAQEQTKTAQEQTKEAKKQKQVADQASAVAQKNEQTAKQQTKKANAATKQATLQTQKAKTAEQTTKVALQNLQVANAATRSANRSLTEQQRKTVVALGVARAEKKKAEAQRRRAIVEKSRAGRFAAAAIAGRKAAQRSAAEARHQQRIALRQARVARANAFAFDALSRVNRDPERTLLLALRARRLGGDPALVERALRLGLLVAKGLRILPGGGGPVTAAVYNPAGTRVLVGARAGARLFDPRTGKRLRKLTPGSPVTAVAFSHDGAVAATGSENGTVVVWSAATGTAIHRFRHDRTVTSIAFSPDDKLLATASADETFALWNAASGELVRRTPVAGVVRSVAFSPDGSKLLVVAAITVAQSPARLYDIATGDLVQSFSQRGQITTAALSPDGTLVATGGRDDLAAIWDARDGHLVRTLVGHTADVLSVTFSPDGAQLATTSSDVTTRLWNLRTFGLRFTLVGHTTSIVSAAFSPDGTRLVTAGTDRIARVWRTTDSAAEALLLGHTESVTSAVFSPDGTRVLTAGADGNARIWDPVGEPAMPVLGKQDGRLFGVSFSADGKRISTAGADGAARVWDVARRTELAKLVAGVPLTDSALSPDGRFVAAAGNDGSARIWPAGGGGATVIAASAKPLRAVAFSPDSRLLAVASDDGTATIWRWGTRTRIATIPHPAATAVLDVAFSPDGTLLATGAADGLARLWRVSDGRLVREFRNHTDGVTGVAFSRDGRRLATSSRDKDARLWDVGTGATLSTFRGHSSVVSGVGLSADGKWLVTAGPIKAGIWATSGNDLAGDRLLFLVGPTGQLTSAAFAPSGQTIAVTSFDGTLRTYDCVLCGGLDRLVAAAEARLRALGELP